MPIIIELLAAGVSLAIDKYQERQTNAARNAGTDSHNQDTGLETGIISSDAERRREEEAFHELQNYADFQKALSSKVLDELSRDYSFSAPYSPESNASSNRPTGNTWYDPWSRARYTIQGRLPSPIIISQKTLGSDGPGWVRTYSPALMDCGIPQEPFLKFLDAFNESLRFTPQLEAVNVAALESGICWRDKTTGLSTAIPKAVRIIKVGQASRDIVTFLDHANISFFSPRALFAMVITSAPDDLSQVLTVNIFDSSSHSTSGLNMQGLNFGDMDHRQTDQPQPRRPNKLHKMSNFIYDYSDRRAHPQPHNQPNLPLLSLISSISNARESKRDLRRRRTRIFQHTARPSSGSSGVGGIEGAFGGAKVGKVPGSGRGIVERVRREDGGDNARDGGVRDAEIKPGALYLMIVNDPDNDQKISDEGELYDEQAFNIDPALNKGKWKESHWLQEDEGENGIPEMNNADQQPLDERMEGADELPPRYSSIHPQHQARVQAWREENPESDAHGVNPS